MSKNRWPTSNLAILKILVIDRPQITTNYELTIYLGNSMQDSLGAFENVNSYFQIQLKVATIYYPLWTTLTNRFHWLLTCQ